MLVADPPPTPSPPAAMTTGQVARWLGVDVRTVRRWCDRLGLYHERGSFPGAHRRIFPLYLYSFLRREPAARRPLARGTIAALGLDGPALDGVCRECGCTDDRACPGGCWWVEPDLCSACAGAAA